jgi:hypothetical protein
LAAELERQTATRLDYIAPQGALTAEVIDADVRIGGFNGEPAAITNYAHGQLSDVLRIPKGYYDRMRAEQPAILRDNLNGWLRADPQHKRMLRTLDGKVRAVLSPKYRPLDNYDLANAILPKLIDRRDADGNKLPSAQIVSAELTETRMFIKAILPELSDELPAGLAYGGHNRIDHDRGHVVAAVVISNSEVGAGTLKIEPSVFTTFCTNLAILAATAMRKYHVGRANETTDSWEVFRDETRKADDTAFWLKVTDVTNSAFQEGPFRAAVEQLRLTAGQPITASDLPKVVSLAVEQLALPVTTGGQALKFLAAGGDLTQWGLASALTRVANEAPDYEGATDLERAGGKLLAYTPGQWNALNAAAA